MVPPALAPTARYFGGVIGWVEPVNRWVMATNPLVVWQEATDRYSRVFGPDPTVADRDVGEPVHDGFLLDGGPAGRLRPALVVAGDRGSAAPAGHVVAGIASQAGLVGTADWCARIDCQARVCRDLSLEMRSCASRATGASAATTPCSGRSCTRRLAVASGGFVRGRCCSSSECFWAAICSTSLTRFSSRFWKAGGRARSDQMCTMRYAARSLHWPCSEC